jgi:hypothetical protein
MGWPIELAEHVALSRNLDFPRLRLVTHSALGCSRRRSQGYALEGLGRRQSHARGRARLVGVAGDLHDAALSRPPIDGRRCTTVRDGDSRSSVRLGVGFG